MQPMNDGMNLDLQVLTTTLQNKLAQSAIREAQMEAGIQQLMAENQELHITIQGLSEVQDDQAEEG